MVTLSPLDTPAATKKRYGPLQPRKTLAVYTKGAKLRVAKDMPVRMSRSCSSAVWRSLAFDVGGCWGTR